eukprot:CAMPEP_0177360022 /NCGR_PEP_ID=MMETSP0368-20130122/36428_1 /TAXON_ID=447022 ORGANISM="Scrippsiella hangoei-like, Strain SHHI-4" /NCGR_SAMPLE_ID=MMETSP0368 /ASSEMBLY_ACC=CAM_ASM_000363 /LENGTH=404 /DNA_ID=CAMNT_0018822575 /DNA_START=88 /DNA_END=1299 /DNA_ORIENTATION=-
MGSSLSQTLDEALKVVLEVGSSKVDVGLGSSSYTASKDKLRAIRLAEGLLLTGEVASIKASGSTLQALGAAFGRPPPLSVEVSGVRLRIGTGGAAAGTSTPVSLQKLPQELGGAFKRTGDLLAPEKLLARLEAEVKDVEVELQLGGHTLRVHLAALKARARPPAAGGRFGGAAGVAAAAGPGGERRVDAAAHLDVDQLLALLDIAAALEAIVAVEVGEASAPRVVPKAACGVTVTFQGADLRLDMAEEPLLEAKCQKGSVSVPLHGTSADVRLEPLEVRAGGGAGWVSSSEACLHTEAPDGRPDKVRATLRHCFPGAESEHFALPWRGTIELLLADPRFAPHRAWLEAARDGLESEHAAAVPEASARRGGGGASATQPQGAALGAQSAWETSSNTHKWAWKGWG